MNHPHFEVDELMDEYENVGVLLSYDEAEMLSKITMAGHLWRALAAANLIRIAVHEAQVGGIPFSWIISKRLSGPMVDKI